jgi:hypothetical protein
MLAGEKRCDELRATAGSCIERNNDVSLIPGKGVLENRRVLLKVAEYR